MKTKLQYLFFLLPLLSFGQELLKGKLINLGDKEGIHVFNKTYQKYTVTDQDGNFEISARLKDTIVFSAIQYKLKSIVISEKELSESELLINLEEQTNALDEVYIGYKLTGDLSEDSKHIETEEDFGKEVSMTFKGLGKFTGILPNDSQSKVENEVMSQMPQGINILGLIRTMIPKKKKVIIKETPPLSLTKEAIMKYFGENFFKDTVEINEDVELFIQYCEYDLEIQEALSERNELNLLTKLIEKGKEFKASRK